jgi:hypothetical protein
MRDPEKQRQVLRVLGEMVEEFDQQLEIMAAYDTVGEVEDRRELHGRDGSVLVLTVKVTRQAGEGQADG